MLDSRNCATARDLSPVQGGRPSMPPSQFIVVLRRAPERSAKCSDDVYGDADLLAVMTVMSETSETPTDALVEAIARFQAGQPCYPVIATIRR